MAILLLVHLLLLVQVLLAVLAVVVSSLHGVLGACISSWLLIMVVVCVCTLQFADSSCSLGIKSLQTVFSIKGAGVLCEARVPDPDFSQSCGYFIHTMIK